MNNVVFERIILISEIEKKARCITFDRITIITGNINTTGKSCVLKSLYHTLGADVVFEDEWYPLKTKSFVEFRVGNQKYKALRSEDRITIFDENDLVLISTTSITNDLAPFISQLFDFDLKLIRNGNSSIEIQATPAFLYLPFYIDQDLGWKEYFSSFNGLKMFRNWQDPFKNYHTGIRPKEYYAAVNQIKKAEDEKQLLNVEVKLLVRTREKFESVLGNERKDINIKDDCIALDSHILDLERCKLNEDVLRKSLYVTNENRLDIECQIDELKDIITNANRELSATKEVTTLICSKCGSIHESKLYREYSLLSDLNNAGDVMLELLGQKSVIESEANTISNSLKIVRNELKSIETKVEEQHRELSLNGVLDSFALTRSESVIDSEINIVSIKENEINRDIEALEDQKKNFNDRKRTKVIKDHYLNKLESNFHGLKVTAGSLSEYRSRFTPPSNKLKTGSRAPRQMLAVYYAFIDTIYSYSTTARMPIVIDSPKQQEQDQLNSNDIVDFCTRNLPNEAQLILATINYSGMNENITLHNFSDYKQLLCENDFELYSKMINELYDKAMRSIGEHNE